jgi:hypothetical protein
MIPKNQNNSSDPRDYRPISLTSCLAKVAERLMFLFSIFINDIPINYMRNKNYSLLFADDLCSFHIFKKKKTSVRQIQHDLKRIEI